MSVRTLLVGCGRLGGAILSGWKLTGSVPMAEIGILTPSRKAVADAAAADGADLSPRDMSSVETVVLAVKPAKWRAVSEDLASQVPVGATLISVMAAVRADAMAEVWGHRPIARVMPTTAVSQARGVAATWGSTSQARDAIERLFGPLAKLVPVEREAEIDVATAMSGSGAAFAYAFVRALARAGIARGLTDKQALDLALATVAGAVGKLEMQPNPDGLVAEVASPGGTTEAGLRVLEPSLTQLLDRTVAASLERVEELSLGG
ncbi:pyrroline-5-carboxylate reductase family protein [Brevundimonas aveniformis]|uniref:pyrroline-5-carboxylate reductase family protein n=1 Tax=Brevundimonas aveniformis TaxID=370977 RepID=UPI000403A1D2|nr:pyrroline-5-carboxylate reductase dimerization domain-containing protein [Brevundimonas aveniformis]